MSEHEREHPALLWLPAYEALIDARAPFPPKLHAFHGPVKLRVSPAGFPPRGHTTHSSVAVPTGPGPSTPEPPIKGEDATMRDPRVPPGPTPYYKE
jgi:3-phenylpropionate/trans-cinnamate dioxygenase ferredoxin reductase component